MIAFVYVTLRTRSHAFNAFFLACLLGLTGALALPARAADSPATTKNSSSKKSSKDDDVLAIVRVYAEVTDDGTVPKATVLRSQPFTLPINKQPFLDERDVARATLLDTPDGGFMIQIEGTSHAKQALEMSTITANGRHLVIFGQWSMPGQEKPEERWLAAPLIRGPLRNGTLVFSADCSREEALRIVDGLNKVAVKLKNQPKSKSGATSSTSSGKTKPASTPNSAAQESIQKSQR